MAKKITIEPYLSFVRSLYDENDSVHNFRHIERIFYRLDSFIRAEKINPDYRLLYFLSAFHGLSNRIKNTPDFKAGIVAFLSALGWNDEEIFNGFIALEYHLIDPQTIEEKIVYDANYIELLGAFGIAKAFTTGGARNQSIEETIRIYKNEYLDRVEFKTCLGRKLLKKEREYSIDFLEKLQSELDNPIE
jgi:hypothetical protein